MNELRGLSSVTLTWDEDRVNVEHGSRVSAVPREQRSVSARWSEVVDADVVGRMPLYVRLHVAGVELGDRAAYPWAVPVKDRAQADELLEVVRVHAAGVAAHAEVAQPVAATQGKTSVATGATGSPSAVATEQQRLLGWVTRLSTAAIWLNFALLVVILVALVVAGVALASIIL